MLADWTRRGSRHKTSRLRWSTHTAQLSVHLKCRSTGYESQALPYSWLNCSPLHGAGFQTGEAFGGGAVLLCCTVLWFNLSRTPQEWGLSLLQS